MTQVMDLLEDYFAYRGYMYLRLDGSVSITARHPSIPGPDAAAV